MPATPDHAVREWRDRNIRDVGPLAAARAPAAEGEGP